MDPYPVMPVSSAATITGYPWAAREANHSRRSSSDTGVSLKTAVDVAMTSL